MVINESEIYSTSKSKVDKLIEKLRISLAKIRTGRAQMNLLDHIKVNYFNSFVSINKLANLNIIDACTINIHPYEKQLFNPIEKAIRESDLDLNPIPMGENIRVIIPSPTKERRKELTKIVKNIGEETKIAIRNIRREANESFKRLVKNKMISEDDERRLQTNIQKLINIQIANIDMILSEKETEIMKI